MKQVSISGSHTIYASCSLTNSFALKVVSVFLLCSFSLLSAYSQGGRGNSAKPSCKLSGVLEARPNNATRGAMTEIVVTAEVAKSEANSTLSYSFPTNTSNAVVKSYGPVNYDAATKKTTQQVVIYPGIADNGFNIQLIVTNPDGSQCSCSKSVSVSN